MLAITAPYPQFFDLDGEPLDNGKLYFGVANQNPETTPVAVYWDFAGTQPAAQPIATLSGMAVRSGTPAQVYTATDFSLTVRNARGVLVFYAPSALAYNILAQLADTTNAANGAGLVGYNPALSYAAGTVGAELRARTPTLSSISALRAFSRTLSSITTVTGYYTAGDGGGGTYFYDASDTTSADNGGTIIVASDGARWKLSVFAPVTVRQFGAKGDHVTDDSAAFQAAMNWVMTHTLPETYGSNTPALGDVVLNIPAGSYLIGTQLVITHKITMQGEGTAEASGGTRIQQNFAGDLFLISPVAQGMSFAFRDVTMLSGVNGTTGFLVKGTRGSSNGANSCRFQNCVFFNPQGAAVLVSGDDWSFTDCTFDVSIRGGNSIQLGDAAATEVASNCRFVNCNWFNCVTRIFFAWRYSNVTVTGCGVSQDVGTNTFWFFDAGNNPTLGGTGFHVTGCTIVGVQQLLFLGPNCINTVFANNDCYSLGVGAGSTVDAILAQSTLPDIALTGNSMVGNLGTKSFYNDAGNIVSSAVITGNRIVQQGTGQALQCSKTVGAIRGNRVSGSTLQSVSERRATTGTPFAPGPIASGAVSTATVSMLSAQFGDQVDFTPILGAWPVPPGIEMCALVSGANTLQVLYRNGTAGTITPTAHDLVIEVYR